MEGAPSPILLRRNTAPEHLNFRLPSAEDMEGPPNMVGMPASEDLTEESFTSADIDAIFEEAVHHKTHGRQKRVPT